MSFNDRIDTLLTALASDDADAVERALQIYDVNDIVAVMAKRLLDAEGGGGSSSAFSRTRYFSSLLAIAKDTWVNPPWGASSVTGKAVLDLTDPANPTAVADGLYMVSLEFQLSNPAEQEAGKSMYVELDVDLNGFDSNVATNQSLDPANDPGGLGIQASCAVSAFVPAGGVINAAVQHNLSADMASGLLQVYVAFAPATLLT